MKSAALDLSKLVESLRELAESLETFRFDNWDSLSKKMWDDIGTAESKLLEYAAYLTTLIVEEILQDAQESLKNLQKSIQEAKKAVANIKAFGNVADIISAIIGLGIAAAAKNPKAIITALNSLLESATKNATFFVAAKKLYTMNKGEMPDTEKVLKKTDLQVALHLKKLSLRIPHSGIASLGGKNYAIVKVFYATNRNLTSNAAPSRKYGVGRSKVTYGTCDVSVPAHHKIGKMESPSFLRLEFLPDPQKHIVLLKVSVQEQNKYFLELKKRISGSTGKKALIFIHGYNVSFENAARRTAQIFYDLQFEGTPVFYSWPSRERLLRYPVDVTNAEWAEADLKRFLYDFTERTDAEKIYLIAHSLGNRTLTLAFRDLIGEKPELRERFSEIILTAPDIDADLFKRKIAPNIIDGRPQVTLYASSKDMALRISKTFNGYARLGDVGPDLVLLPKMDTIDATAVDTSFLGHSYFSERRSVLSDIYALIQGKRPNERFALESIKQQGREYWKFKE